jgi:hypothetical protein
MGDEKSYKIIVRKHKWKRPVRKVRHRWKNNIQVDIK